MMTHDPEGFKTAVQRSLKRHLAAVQSLRESDGLLFFDYGNAFLLECHRAGCEVDKEIPSYVGMLLSCYHPQIFTTLYCTVVLISPLCAQSVLWVLNFSILALARTGKQCVQ